MTAERYTSVADGLMQTAADLRRRADDYDAAGLPLYASGCRAKAERKERKVADLLDWRYPTRTAKTSFELRIAQIAESAAEAAAEMIAEQLMRDPHRDEGLGRESLRSEK